jgi:hypothetical protein
MAAAVLREARDAFQVVRRQLLRQQGMAVSGVAIRSAGAA